MTIKARETFRKKLRPIIKRLVLRGHGNIPIGASWYEYDLRQNMRKIEELVERG